MELEMNGVPALLQDMRSRSRLLEQRVRFRAVGTVQNIGNGIATISGLPDARLDELVTFPTGVQGLVFNLEREHIAAIVLGADSGIQGGDLVEGTGHRLQIAVGSELLGRVVNPLGKPLDELGVINTSTRLHLERDARGIVQRAPISQPLHTGWKTIDALLPIGRGQRELILGDRQTGKTSLALDAILNQSGDDVQCVYVAIGQKKTTTLRIIETLREHDALAYTIVVVATPDDPPALRYLAPYAGCTLAEGLRAAGHDVLIVYDDLTKHADAYRELSLLLRRPPGREAYPGDIFYLHSRLLERAGRFSADYGGGSITALPIVQTQQGNVSAYIPTNLISITDGQIILDANLFNRGIKPAVDVGLSVSRVGGAAQTAAMRAVAGRLRLELAQFEEVAQFARFGADVDEATRQQIERGQRLQTVLTQSVHRPMSPAQQIIVLFAATQGFFDEVDFGRITQTQQALIIYVEHTNLTLVRQLNEGAWDDDIESALLHIINEWQQSDDANAATSQPRKLATPSET